MFILLNIVLSLYSLYVSQSLSHGKISFIMHAKESYIAKYCLKLLNFEQFHSMYGFDF